MSSITPTFRGNLRPNALYIFGSCVLVIVSTYEAVQFILNDQLIGLAYIAMFCVGAAFLIITLKNWRIGLYLFFTWLLFEDFARKFLGNNMAIYFAKDLLVAVVYLAFFIAYRRRAVQSFKPPFLVSLSLLMCFGLMQVFNPQSTSIFFGLMGMKLYFYYVPLLFLGYALLRTEMDLRRFLLWNMVLALIIVGLGIAQSMLGHTFLNPAVASDELRELSQNYRVSRETGLISYRPTSIFVSGGRYMDYLFLLWLLVLGASCYFLLRYRRGRNLAFVTIAVVVGGVVLCGGRTTLMLTIINGVVTTVAFVWGAPAQQGQRTGVLRAVRRTASGVMLAGLLLFFIFPDALLSRVAFYEESLLPTSSTSDLSYRTWDYPLENFANAFKYEHWLSGYGIGTASLGGQYVTKFFHVSAPTNGTESGFGVLVVEMGIVGLFLWIAVGCAVCISAFKVVRKLRGTPLFAMGFVIAWYAFILYFPYAFLGMQAFQDFVISAYLWLLLGMLFRLPTLPLSADFATAF